MDLVTPGQVLVVIALVAANGFFVAAEFSLVAMRRSRVQQLLAEGHPLGPMLQRATRQLDTYLAATQLGITMASIGLGWVGEPLLAGLIGPAFGFLPQQWEIVSAELLALIVAFGLVTVLHIVLGELAPKSLALQRTERTALLTVAPLELFLRIFRPAIVALNGLGNLTLGLFGLQPGSGEGGVHSVEELQLLVAASRGAGLVSEKAQDIVERALRLDDLTARQVMVPRVAIVGVPLHTSLQRALDIAVESRHTRLPVYRDSIDDVVGVVSVMSLLAELSRASPRPLAEVARPALLVPQAIRADVLLSRMRTRGRSLAVLIDEFGGTAGLVTASDLVDELVGPMLEKDEDNPERRGENA